MGQWMMLWVFLSPMADSFQAQPEHHSVNKGLRLSFHRLNAIANTFIDMWWLYACFFRSDPAAFESPYIHTLLERWALWCCYPKC